MTAQALDPDDHPGVYASQVCTHDEDNAYIEVDSECPAWKMKTLLAEARSRGFEPIPEDEYEPILLDDSRVRIPLTIIMEDI